MQNDQDCVLGTVGDTGLDVNTITKFEANPELI